MRNALRLLAALITAATVLAPVACSKKAARVVAPPVAPPLEIEAVSPAPYQSGVLETPEIWAQFAEPLDSASVSARTVYLKVDTRRMPVTITYDGAARRIRLVPQFALVLREVYTVELSTGIRSTSGHSLAVPYRWEFTRIGVRLPEAPDPAPGTANESPYRILKWQGTEAGFGGLSYHVYVGEDSAQVAARAVPPQTVRDRAWYLPDSRWALGTRLYWCVTAENRVTEETRTGPVWSFETLPADTPIDSLSPSIVNWGYFDVNVGRRCSVNPLRVSGSVLMYLRWGLDLLSPQVRIAGVRVTLRSRELGLVEERHIRLTSSTRDWLVCAPLPSPNDTIGAIGISEPVIEGDRLVHRFGNDLFAAQIENAARNGVVRAYIFRALSIVTSTFDVPGPGDFTVYYYRLPETPPRP